MPAGAIEQHNGMVARRDVATDLGEMQVHHLAVGYRQDEGDAGIARGTDSAEQIRPIVALVARCPRSAAALVPKVIPEGRSPRPRPPTPLIYWGDLSVTGNGDLPLATQRRVESIASDRSPLRRRLTTSISLVCGQLFSSLFFFDFHRTNFSGFPRPFHQFRSGWLCYFC